MIKGLVGLIIILIVSLLPKFNNKNKFRIEMFTNGIINKFVLFGIVIYVATLDIKLGLLAFLLSCGLIYTGSTENEIVEGFKNYFSKN